MIMYSWTAGRGGPTWGYHDGVAGPTWGPPGANVRTLLDAYLSVLEMVFVRIW